MDFTALLGKLNLKDWLNVEIDTTGLKEELTKALIKPSFLSEETEKNPSFLDFAKRVNVEITDKTKTMLFLIGGALLLYFMTKDR